MLRLTRKLLPYLVLLAFVAVAFVIKQYPPEAKKSTKVAAVTLSVEVVKLITEDYQVVIDSFGKLVPKTKSQLTAQVSGLVVKISDNFNQGSFFDAGEILVTIDPRDFEIKVEAAAAELAQAKVAFDEEVALSRQAIKDRRSLGHASAASDFALRKPQMAAAKAKMQAANATLKQAKLDVERTEIRAPFTGRIQSKGIDLGQVVNTNTNIAQIYATDVLEISLPIKNSELGLIDLPRNKLVTKNSAQAPDKLVQDNVVIINDVAGEQQRWPATLLRTSGGVDPITQQLHVIAQIQHPFNHPHLRSLNVGQFVRANITAKLITNTIVIPNSAIYQGSYVYVSVHNKLQRREIKIRHQNNEHSVISSGLQAGELLIITPLGQVSSGIAIKIIESDSIPIQKALETQPLISNARITKGQPS
jgi:RND family efflux transporter MFP subunit